MASWSTWIIKPIFAVYTCAICACITCDWSNLTWSIKDKSITYITYWSLFGGAEVKGRCINHIVRIILIILNLVCAKRFFSVSMYLMLHRSSWTTQIDAFGIYYQIILRLIVKNVRAWKCKKYGYSYYNFHFYILYIF